MYHNTSVFVKPKCFCIENFDTKCGPSYSSRFVCTEFESTTPTIAFTEVTAFHNYTRAAYLPTIHLYFQCSPLYAGIYI